MQDNCLILGASKYDFTDSSTNNRVAGVTVWILHNSLADSDNTNGSIPKKYSLPASKMHMLDDLTLPCYATVTFNFDFNRNRITPAAFVPVADFNFAELQDA